MVVIPTSTIRSDMAEHGIEIVPWATTSQESFRTLPYRQVTAASQQGSLHMSDSTGRAVITWQTQSSRPLSLHFDLPKSARVGRMSHLSILPSIPRASSRLAIFTLPIFGLPEGQGQMF